MKKDYIRDILKPLIPKYILAILLGVLLNLLIIGSTYISKFLLDEVLPSGNTSLLAIFVIGYLFYYLFRNFASFMKEYLFSKHGYKILCDIRSHIFSAIISRFSFSSFSSEKQGYIITLFTNWLNSISWFLYNILLTTVTECILLIIAFVVLAAANIKMFFITLATLPLYGVVYFLFNANIRRDRKAMMEKDADVTQNLKDALDSIKEIRVLNTESVFLDKYDMAQKEFTDYGLKYVIITSLYDSLSNIISILGNMVVLYFGGMEVFQGNMTIGTLIALNSIVALLYAPIERIVNFNRLQQGFKVELNKLDDFMQKNAAAADAKESPFYQPENPQMDEKTVLRLDKVSFSYGNLNVLNNISMDIREGRSYAVVGDNGSGKSTLINLMTGLLVPGGGNIFYCGTNIWQDLRQFRGELGYVPQDTFLLNDTIVNNIIFGRENCSHCSLEELMELCEVSDILKANSMEEDTLIGERGSKLSGGQKQKIALCRALYTGPKILIIDEGTSNTDFDSESRILEKIKKKFPKMSIVIVSHRLSTIRIADHIIVLKDAGILEQGSREQLFYNQDSKFYRMFVSQMQNG